MSHQSKPPLTHVGQLSLDTAAETPELQGDTEILSEELVARLSDNLPARLIGNDWRLIYSTSTHGFSLSSLYRRCSTSTNGPTLLCVQDTNRVVFGALVSSPIVMSEHFYGTGESFLFRTDPCFQVYNWTGDNPHFAR